ncbi:MAG TPA: hypothetical protein VNW15_11835 [Rhizomicrobium sp.]|jgi:hypothetical protein|nr:hypothetical protein [Rhizomicrobium sp.]
MKDIHPGLVAEADLRGGTYWFAPEYALAVVREAVQHGLPLLGIEGAFLGANSTQPSLEDSWDYGTHPVADPHRHAFGFIQERARKGLHFEIVLAE